MKHRNGNGVDGRGALEGVMRAYAVSACIAPLKRIAAGVVLSVFTAEVASAQVVSNLGESDAGTYFSGNSDWIAITITTDASYYQLNSITIDQFGQQSSSPQIGRAHV